MLVIIILFLVKGKGFWKFSFLEGFKDDCSHRLVLVVGQRVNRKVSGETYDGLLIERD